MLDLGENTYILGQPITTPIGKAHPIMVPDYDAFSIHMNGLFRDKSQTIKIMKDVVSGNNGLQPFLDFAEQVDFFTFVKYFQKEIYRDSFFYLFYSEQKELFEYIFKEDVFDQIENEEDFELYRELIKKMNDITYEPPNPNPELARLDRLKHKLMELKGDLISFEAMYTSILIGSSTPPDDLTMYQFNKAFDRIGHFKSYDTSTLFKTVDQGGKLEISPWYKMTEKTQPGTLSQEQLDKARQLTDEGGLKSSL